MNGFFNIDKPQGISSAKCVWLIKKKFNIKDKIGHLGTLDPLASGVLVVAVGRANRLFEKMKEKHKTYITTFEFGYQTISLDSERKEIEFDGGRIPTKQEIINVLPKLLGEQFQTAPAFSAKNINGQRAYQMARDGKSFEIKPHKIYIYNIELLKQLNNKSFQFLIECSGGTYIRSICRDLAKNLNTYATMVQLRRVKSGIFAVETSKTLDNITEDDIIPVDYVLHDLQILPLSSLQIQTLKNGIIIDYDIFDGEYLVKENDLTIGIAIVENKKVKMKTWLL